MSKSTDFQALLNRYRLEVIATREALMGAAYNYRSKLVTECATAQELQDMFEVESKGEKV